MKNCFSLGLSTLHIDRSKTSWGKAEFLREKKSWVQAPNFVQSHSPGRLWFSSLIFIPPCSFIHLSLCWRSASSLSSLAWQAGCSSKVAGGLTLATTTRLKCSMQLSRFSLFFRSFPCPWHSIKCLPSPAVPFLTSLR